MDKLKAVCDKGCKAIFTAKLKQKHFYFEGNEKCTVSYIKCKSCGRTYTCSVDNERTQYIKKQISESQDKKDFLVSLLKAEERKIKDKLTLKKVNFDHI